jgi:hypothetical protein
MVGNESRLACSGPASWELAVKPTRSTNRTNMTLRSSAQGWRLHLCAGTAEPESLGFSVPQFRQIPTDAPYPGPSDFIVPYRPGSPNDGVSGVKVSF